MRSEAEILADMERVLQAGERDGSIHSNPPSENYLKDVLPNETAKDAEPSAATTAVKHSEEKSQVAPLSREQLRNLLDDFLEQLAASKLPAGEAPEDVLVVDQNLWDTMTATERSEYLHKLLRTEKSFTLNGVTYVEDSNQGPVSTSFGGWSGKVPAKSGEPAP